MSEAGKRRETPQSEPQPLVPEIPHRVVVFSGKGGVGKTTVAVNLAYALARYGLNVGLFDADVTGPNVARMTGVDEPARVQSGQPVPHERRGVRVVSLATMLPADAPVIWRGPMRSKAIEQLLAETAWGDVDTLVVDLPPGTGDEVLTTAQRLLPQVAVIVTTPQAVSRIDARRAVSFAKRLNIPFIGLVENMSGLVCPHCGETIDLFGAGTTESDAQALAIEHLGTIPLDPAVPRESDAGEPPVLMRPGSPTAAAVLRIARAVARQLGIELQADDTR
jgi:ATP-binding protein involved in chromosome partitioning